MFLSRGRRAALTFPFAASVWLAALGLGAPAEGSYGVLTRGRGPFLVTLDPEGHRTSTTTPKGQTTTTTYDEVGKPLDVTQPKPSADAPANPVTHFRYDENRNLVRMEDADGRVIRATRLQSAAALDELRRQAEVPPREDVAAQSERARLRPARDVEAWGEGLRLPLSEARRARLDAER